MTVKTSFSSATLIFLSVTMCFVHGESVTLPCHESIYLCTPSCEDRIADSVGVISVYHSSTEPRYSCRCDRRCAIYGDCCQDYWENCVKEDQNDSHPIYESIYSPYMSCLTQLDSIDKFAFTDSYWVVGRCPERWRLSDEVRGFCEDIYTNSERFLSLYVSGPDGTVFRNLYCAICHGVEVGSLKRWSLGLYLCPGKEMCFLILPPQNLSSDPHLCQPNVIDYCPSTSDAIPTPQNNHSTCHDIAAFLFDINNVLAVKNPTCIYCNALPSNTSFSCKPEEQDPEFGQWIERTLLLLFYFGGIPGDESHADVRHMGKTERFAECGPYTVFDPFQRFCRPIPYISTNGVVILSPLRLNESSLCLRSHLSILFDPPVPIAVFAIEVDDWIKKTTPSRPVSSLAKPSLVFVALVHFEGASRVLESLKTFLERSSDPRGDPFHCGGSDDVITHVTLLVSEQPINETHPEIPVCDGYIIQDVGLDQLSRGNNTFLVNLENHSPFKQKDLIHQTTLSVNNSHVDDAFFVSTSSFLKMCSPLAGDQTDCHVLNKSFFQMDQSREALIHTSSGHLLNSTDFWLLPGDLVRVCNLPSSQSIRDLFSESLYTLSKVSEVLSLGSLVFTLVTYCLFPSLRTLPGICVIHLIVALLLSDCTLLLGYTTIQWLCTVRGLFLHFSWLAVFFWMNVIAGSLALKIHQLPRRRVHLQSSVLLKLSFYAWGSPFTLVAVCFVASLFPSTGMRYGGTFCWIESPQHSLIVFGLPVAGILVVNAICLIYTIGVIVCSNNIFRNHGRRQRDRSDLLVCVKLYMITGVTWLLFALANWLQNIPVWYLSALINSLQGVSIMLVFTCKASVRRMWRAKLNNAWLRRRNRRVADVPLPATVQHPGNGEARIEEIFETPEE